MTTCAKNENRPKYFCTCRPAHCWTETLCEVTQKRTLSETGVTSTGNQSEHEVESECNQSQVKTVLSTFKTTSKRDRRHADVMSKRSRHRIEIDVNSKRHRSATELALKWNLNDVAVGCKRIWGEVKMGGSIIKVSKSHQSGNSSNTGVTSK